MNYNFIILHVDFNARVFHQPCLRSLFFDSSGYLAHCAEDEAVTFYFQGYDHRQHGELVEVVFDRKVTTKL